MPMIDEKYSDTIGRIRFPIYANNDYDPISTFYQITGAVPDRIVKPDGGDYVYHYVRLRNLPSIIPMGVNRAPTYTLEYLTDYDEQGLNRMIIRNAEKQCVVRYQWMYPGWRAFANENPKSKSDNLIDDILP